jgi:WD40 repeat protein
MADVFLSYAREDGAKAKVLADALFIRGCSVWWDRAIPPGRTFDHVIEEELNRARCVVVLWSKTAVASHWVLAEASEAARRQILVPAFLDEVRVPLEFRRIQAADLKAWNGEAGHAEFREFVDSISMLVLSAEPVARALPSDLSTRRLQGLTASRRRARRFRTALVLMLLVGLMGVGFGIRLLQLRKAQLAEALAINAQRTQDTDPLRALVLAIAAAKQAVTAETRSALERALQDRYPRALLHHQETILDASFSPDDRSVVTASSDSTARVWNGQTGEPVGEALTHAGQVVTARFSPDNRLVVTASVDKTARVWDATSGKLIKPLEGHTGPLVTAKFSLDGQFLVTASIDGVALLWSVRTLQIVTELRGHSGPIVWAGFAPDSRSLLTVSVDGTGRVWQVETGAPLTVLEGHAAPVVDAAFSYDGRFIATASGDGTVRRWEMPQGISASRDGSQSPSAQPIALAAFRRAAPPRARARRLRSITTAESEGRLAISSVSFSPNSQWILGTTHGGPASLWDATTGRTVMTLASREAPGLTAPEITSAVFSPDGNDIAGACTDGTVLIWNRETGERIAILRGHMGPIRRVVFSADGKDLITASDDGTAAIWRNQTPTINQSSSFRDLLNRAQASLPVTLTADDLQRLAR